MEITRRCANHHPSVWGDHFLAYANLLVINYFMLWIFFMIFNKSYYKQILTFTCVGNQWMGREGTWRPKRRSEKNASDGSFQIFTKTWTYKHNTIAWSGIPFWTWDWGIVELLLYLLWWMDWVNLVKVTFMLLL